MKTNLIQNYITNPSVQGYKDPKDFDIKEVLANKTFIKPLPGKGRLIKGNLFDAPGIMVKGLAYDVKSLKHGIQGHANDHELGKLNDVGLKIGALAIGAYLFTKRYTPKTKWMEFVGPATFLASMAIWPKLAIQLPALLIHGTNVQKKYEDSFGRKKPFYQDPQFIPWDLYTDKQINKIGNRLGVPKDIPNRREFVQEKMKKIAVQNNTLWMLTAGFATPVMSALMCNAIEPYMLKYQNKALNSKAEKMLDNMPKYAEKFKSNKMLNNVERFMQLYKDQPLKPELFEQVSGYITEGFDPITTKGFKKDLKNILMDSNFHIDKNTANNIITNSRKILEQNFEHSIVEKMLPSESDLLKVFTDKNMLNKTVKAEELNKLGTSVGTLILDKLNEFKRNNTSVKIDIRSPKVKSAISVDTIIKSLKNTPEITLNKTSRAFIRNLANIMTDYNSKYAVSLKYAHMKTGASPETDYAYFSSKMEETVLKMLNFTDKDLAVTRNNPSKTNQLLRSKLEAIAANESDYKRVVSEFCEQLTKITKVDVTKYKELNESIFNDLATKLKDLNMPNAVRELVGKNGDATGSLLKVTNEFLEYRLSNINTYNRFLNLLDFMRRLATNTNIDAVKGNFAKEIKEEQIELAIKTAMDAHASDFSIKNPIKRNPNPNMIDKGDITIENGRFKPQYYTPEKPMVELADNGGHFFRRNFNLLYVNDLHPDSSAIYEKYSLLETHKNYRKNMVEKIGNQIYDFKLSHTYERAMHPIFDGERIKNLKVAASNEVNYQALGKTPIDLITDAGRQAFNSKKWLKMFGRIGIGLAAATVLLQFTFGRMKTPRREMTGVNKNA